MLKLQARGGFEAVCARGESLPFSSDSVDTVFYSYSLEEFDNPDAGLAEAARVLRPGGQLVLFLWRVNYLGYRKIMKSKALGDFQQVKGKWGVQNTRLVFAFTGAKTLSCHHRPATSARAITPYDR
ncbi:class I SAM-dependent methyltransferase [Fodinicola feengrottensis]|uniref:class I SAM-dependent methyltransferase n=1 Tax=Fodinicola feengrottensis TaxID=435914 RepID=UPI0013D7EC0E|nr:class I SAM-dependent methyltransferase [Fodinicola feengrottensis]